MKLYRIYSCSNEELAIARRAHTKHARTNTHPHRVPHSGPLSRSPAPPGIQKMEIRTRTTPPSLSSALISNNKTVTKRQSDPAKAQPPQTPCFSFGSVASPATNFMTMAASTRQAQLMNHIAQLICYSLEHEGLLRQRLDESLYAERHCKPLIAQFHRFRDILPRVERVIQEAACCLDCWASEASKASGVL